MSDEVLVVEVGPRDGLQNEQQILPAEQRAALIERLADTGLRCIEAGSFVSPKWVPQMADTEQVLARLRARPQQRYPVLVPNLQGLERALAAGAQEIAVFTAASDAFNRKNINCSVDESLQRLQPVIMSARTQGLRVRGYVSTVLGCPYQGAVPAHEVLRVTRALLEYGCEEVSLGDTIGIGTPRAARELIRLCSTELPVARLAVHFHDTRGQALANTYACLEEGVRVVDASVSGLGGCPYARGASGNLATEDLVYMLEGLGLRTGVDLDALVEVSRWISAKLGREPMSRLARIGRAAA